MINIFWKLWANDSLIMDCLQNYQEYLLLATFRQIHPITLEISSLNLKTTWHTKPKIFLCTKLLENILLEKYLKSVLVALILWWQRLKNLAYCTDYNRNTFVTMKVLAILTNRGCFLLNLEFNKLFPLIFNFNSFVSSTDVDKFIAHSDSIPCHCTGPSFIDKHYRHL